MKTVDHAKMRRSLMEATVSVIASYGTEGCTSKKIAKESKLNEAYIFRYFFDLKDLREKTFFLVEEEIFKKLQKILAEIPEDERTTDERKREAVDAVWNYLLKESDQTLFYLRYFLSTECRGEVLKRHFENCIEYLIAEDCPPDDAEQRAKNGSAQLLTVIQLAAFVHAGALEDNEETKKLVINNLTVS